LILKNTTAQDSQTLAGESVIYELDGDNNIVAVNPVWHDFAVANNAAELCLDQVIGKPLMQFVSGNITKQFWQTLLDKARRANTPLQLDYRCDSPALRRFMRIKLYRGDNETLYVDSAMLRAEPRPVSIHFKRAQQRGAETKVRCSFCNFILYKSHWHEAENLVVTAHAVTLEVIYGICPMCQSAVDNM
jgi:hypothetical protein